MQPPRLVYRAFWTWHRALDRLTGGRVDASGPVGPSLWLTTVGRRSGQTRENALTYLPDGEAFIIVASNIGDDRDPAWWLNLRASPDTSVRLPGHQPRPIHAREASDAERADLWARFVARHPHYADYARRTSRRLPVVVLEPRRAADAGREETPVTEPTP